MGWRIYVNNINCRLHTYYKVTTVGGFGWSEDCEKMLDWHLCGGGGGGGGGYSKARLNGAFFWCCLIFSIRLGRITAGFAG